MRQNSIATDDLSENCWRLLPCRLDLTLVVLQDFKFNENGCRSQKAIVVGTMITTTKPIGSGVRMA